MVGSAVTYAIPYYSGVDYLKRTIESVLAQADDHWQCVVADDGADPGIDRLVHEVGRGRVRYTKNERNLGIDGNFNRCLELAETDLVTVLHADDELRPTYTGAIRAAAAQYPDAAAIYCRVEIIGPHGQPQFSLADFVKNFINPAARKAQVLEGEPGVRALLKANFILAPTLCYRRSILAGRRFPMGLKFVMDWEMTTGLLLAGDQIVGLPETHYRYRRHPDAATSKLTRAQTRFREESEFYDRMRDATAARGWTKCVEIATKKQMVKLNVAYRALTSVAKLELDDAWKSLRILRDL